MVVWDGEVTLNFSVDIKRPCRDYDALRVARPFARMHMSLCTYIWTMNAGACRVFCPLFLVAHSCLRLRHTTVSSVYAYARRVFFRGGSVAPSGKETRMSTGDGEKKRKGEGKKRKWEKIYNVLMYDAPWMFSLDRLRARIDWSLAKTNMPRYVCTACYSQRCLLSLSIRMWNYFRSDKSGSPEPTVGWRWFRSSARRR